MWAWITPRNTLLLHVCHQIWSLHCRSNRSGVARSPKHSGDAGPQPLRWVVVTLRKFFSHPSYRANFGHSAYNWTSVINGYAPKTLPFASRLSKSLEVIETDPDRSATYDFLLVIHSNHEPVLYRFRDKRWFRSKIANLPTNAHAERVLWNAVTAVDLKNTSHDPNI